LTISGTPFCQQPAIRAWQDIDSTVVESPDIPDGYGGLFILAAKAGVVVPGCLWEYEYALYNMNSDRSARAFRVPLPTDAGFQIQNIGFHSIPYHSGEPYAQTPWTQTPTSTEIRWETQTYTQNQNANALRWGTLYNFRFQANRPPLPLNNATVTIDLFKPGTPTFVTGVSVAPAASPVGACCLPDTCTVEAQSSCICEGGTFLGTGTTCTGPDCNCNTIPDSCDIARGTSQDSNQNGVPDECETVRACCLSADGPCIVMNRACCSQQGGWYFASRTACTPLLCQSIAGPSPDP
jgi:hypothetical protein